MVSNAIANKRRHKDVTKILVSGYSVELVNEVRMDELVVNFNGPEDSPYVGVSTYHFESSQRMRTDNMK